MPGHGLDLIMRSAMRGAQGDFALVALRADQERLIIQAGAGPLAENMVGNLMLVRDSVAASVLLTGAPLLVPDYPRQGGAAARRPRPDRFGHHRPARRRRAGRRRAGGRPARRPAELRPVELEDLADFVHRTGTARELQAAREERRAARLVEERRASATTCTTT